MKLFPFSELSFRRLIEALFKRDQEEVAAIKSALETGRSLRGDSSDIWASIQDYPLMCELAKAYAKSGDYDSAQAVIRVCFEMRDEYASISGTNRSATSIQLLCKEFVKQGREDIARHITMKVRNFEAGIPLHRLSEEFVPDREALRSELERIDDSKGPG